MKCYGIEFFLLLDHDKTTFLRGVGGGAGKSGGRILALQGSDQFAPALTELLQLLSLQAKVQLNLLCAAQV